MINVLDMNKELWGVILYFLCYNLNGGIKVEKNIIKLKHAKGAQK